MRLWRYTKNNRTVRCYFTMYFVLFCLATFLLRRYSLSTEKYIDVVFYIEWDFLSGFPLFLAVFAALKLTTLIMLGNRIIDAFSAKNYMQFVRYGVIKYYMIQVRKLLCVIIMTTVSPVYIWCFLSDSYSCPILRIFSYSLFMSTIVLMANFTNSYINQSVTYALFSIFTGYILYLFQMIREELSFCIIFVFCATTIFLLMQRIRSMNYL